MANKTMEEKSEYNWTESETYAEMRIPVQCEMAYTTTAVIVIEHSPCTHETRTIT